jgi:DNA-binding CsgD family transcriptional regulator
MLEQAAARAGALAALGRSDHEEAFRLAAAVSPPGRLAPHVPMALWVAADLIEAAVRTGRTAEAAAHVAAMREAEVFRRQPRFALLAAGSAALVASGDEADRCYRAALDVRGAERFPFERARVQLHYGEHLRRGRAVLASRRQLAAALEAFERLGARSWVDRARHELRTGARSAAAGTALTAQEHEIASLAAGGLSNKQIGARLQLSPRTVSGHLYRAFPKLGVTTRAALRDALNDPSRPG